MCVSQARGSFSKSLLALAVATCAQAALAGTYALSPDGNAVLRIESATAVSSSSFDPSLLSAYPGWTVTKTTGGSVAVNNYDAGWRSSGSAPYIGGGRIDATYSQAGAVGAGKSLNWIQVITTDTASINNAPVPFLDPIPNDDTKPFYLTAAEQAQLSTTKSVKFHDYSTRGTDDLANASPVKWHAKLYAAEYDGSTNIKVYDGVEWGWSMLPATVGSAGGKFLNSVPACPPATCSGLGSNTVTWGIGEPGSLTFAGVANFAPKVSDKFKIGTLTYHNGATQGGSSIDGVDLDINLSFLNVAELNFAYHTTLAITNTPNTDDPAASADYVTFTKGGFSASFHVLEGQTASVDLMATLSTPLQVTPGKSPAAKANKDLIGEPDAAPTGFDLQLMGFENATGGGFVSTVPEPSAVLLLTCGMLVLGARRTMTSYG